MQEHDGTREWAWAVTGLGGLVAIMDTLSASGAVPTADTVSEFENFMRRLTPIKERLVQQLSQMGQLPPVGDGER